MGKFKFSSAQIQNILIGIVCFACPGMFNALTGMGGGGQVDTSIAADANTALYTTFSVFGILGGAITNILGPKLTILLGSLTYALYTSSLLAYNSIASRVFVVVAGAILGIGAGMLWSAQGSLMMSYPTEREKGKFIAVFWVIFNLGGVIGGIIAFISNYSNESQTVTDETYIAFLVIMLVGGSLSLLLVSPQNVVRSDGTNVEVELYPKPLVEFRGVLKVFTEWRMVLLIPLFMASNWLYTYQFNAFNGALFNIRTRSLNNVIYWGAQMIGAYLLGLLLDSSKLSRRSRGIAGLATVFIVGMSMWVGAYIVQLGYTREDHLENRIDFVDFTQSRYGPLVILYFIFGIADSLIQSWSYWLMGAQTNNTAELARYAGFYKAFQSAGGAISWRLDGLGVSFMIQLLINWILLGVAVIPALIVSFTTKESNEGEVHEHQSKDKP